MLGHPVQVNVLDVLRNVNLGYIIVSMLYYRTKNTNRWNYTNFESPCQV